MDRARQKRHIHTQQHDTINIDITRHADNMQTAVAATGSIRMVRARYLHHIAQGISMKHGRHCNEIRKALG